MLALRVLNFRYLLLFLFLHHLFTAKADDDSSTEDDYSSSTTAEDNSSTTTATPIPVYSTPFPNVTRVLAMMRYDGQLYLFYGPLTVTLDGYPYIYTVPSSWLDYTNGRFPVVDSTPVVAGSIWTQLHNFTFLQLPDPDDPTSHVNIHQSYFIVDHRNYDVLDSNTTTTDAGSTASFGDDSGGENGSSSKPFADAPDHYTFSMCYYYLKKVFKETYYACTQLNLVTKCSQEANVGNFGKKDRYRDSALISSATEERVFYAVLDSLSATNNEVFTS